MIFAAGGAATFTAVSGLVYVTGEAGYSPTLALRCLVGVMALLLVFAAVRSLIAFSRRRRDTNRGVGWMEWIPVPLGVLLGFWILIPLLLVLHRHGMTFGLLSLGNADLPNYVLSAQNLAASGFHDSHHVANINMGAFTHRSSYVGATAMLNYVSAATGISVFQAAMASMGVAVSMLAVALVALGRAIWPNAVAAVPLAVTICILAALPVYTYGQYFLGAITGTAAIVTSAAGVLILARRIERAALIAVAAGGAAGVYTYSPLGLPALLILPFASVAAAVICNGRVIRAVVRAVVSTVIAEVVALALAAIALPDSITLARQQSTAVAGWYLPVLSATSALTWPQDIGHVQSHSYVALTWLVILLLVTIGLGLAWRRDRASVILAALIFVSAGLIVLVFAKIYGTDRYQTWKIEAFLLPIVGVSVLPALDASRSGTRSALRMALAVGAGAVLLSPWLAWNPLLDGASTVASYDQSLAAVRDSPALSKVAVLNIRIPDTLQAMTAGAILDKTTIVLTQNSYFQSLVSLSTCTLTTVSELQSGETDYTPLVGDYVLLNRPSACQLKK